MTATTTVDAGRRPDIENEMSEKYHVSWTFTPGVDTGQFNVDAGLTNQARFEALNEDTVEQYKEAIVRGDAFPAVIASRPRKNARLVIIDGNHRLTAHIRAEMPIDVYELATGTRPQTIMLMTYSFNTRHGRPTTEDERVHQALFLIDNGASVDVAAGAVNIPARIVKAAKTRANAERRAAEVGVDPREWDTLNHGVHNRLLSIATDEGFKDAAHLAYAAKLSNDEAKELASRMNSSSSAAKQRALVKAARAEYEDRIQSGGGGVLRTSRQTHGQTPRTRLARALGMVLAIPDDATGIARSILDAERRDIAKECLNAAATLSKIATAIDPSVA